MEKIIFVINKFILCAITLIVIKLIFFIFHVQITKTFFLVFLYLIISK